MWFECVPRRLNRNISESLVTFIDLKVFLKLGGLENITAYLFDHLCSLFIIKLQLSKSLINGHSFYLQF